MSSTTKISLVVSIIFFSAAAGAQGAPVPQILDSKSRLNKIVGEISQLRNPDLVGNAWFYGKDGCFVVANYHVVFGKTKISVENTASGRVIERIVLLENPGVGHKVKFEFDFNSNTQTFSRSSIAQVVALGNFEEGTVAGTREDIVLLRLETCAGVDFAGLKMDRTEENQKNPPGKMTIIASMRTADRQKFVGQLSGCRSTVKTPGAGLVATSCENVAGMSGSMLISEETLRIVGLNVRSLYFEDGTRVGIAISAKYVNSFLDVYFATNTASR